MIKTKQILCLMTLITSFSNAHAFPRGCETSGFAFQNQYLILNDNGAQTLFLIQNAGNYHVSLEHVETRSDVFMSPKLESKLNMNRWSAFSSDINNFYFKCIQGEGENATQINCGSVLNVCQYPRAQFPLSNKGNYWISTNKELAQVIKESASKGIYLKW
jgi:hypothetical protein